MWHVANTMGHCHTSLELMKVDATHPDTQKVAVEALHTLAVAAAAAGEEGIAAAAASASAGMHADVPAAVAVAGTASADHLLHQQQWQGRGKSGQTPQGQHCQQQQQQGQVLMWHRAPAYLRGKLEGEGQIPPSVRPSLAGRKRQWQKREGSCQGPAGKVPLPFAVTQKKHVTNRLEGCTFEQKWQER